MRVLIEPNDAYAAMGVMKVVSTTSQRLIPSIGDVVADAERRDPLPDVLEVPARGHRRREEPQRRDEADA